MIERTSINCIPKDPNNVMTFFNAAFFLHFMEIQNTIFWLLGLHKNQVPSHQIDSISYLEINFDINLQIQLKKSGNAKF